MNDKRVGIIGFGQMGELHAKSLMQREGTRIVAVHDIDAARLEAARGEYGFDTFAGLGEFFDVEMDHVFVCTPPEVREEPIRMAVERGCHIYCEKPIAIDLGVADKILNVLSASDGAFMVGYNLRYKEGYRVVKELVDSGRFGSIVSCWINKREYFSSLKWKKILDSGSWRMRRECGGGRYIERSHQLDWLLWIGGEAREVYGRWATVAPGIDLDDTNYSLIAFDNGVGQFSSVITPNAIDQTDAGVLLEKAFIRYDGKKIQARMLDRDEYVEVAAGKRSIVYDRFFGCCETGGGNVSSALDARHTLAVCMAFERSAMSRRAAAVDRNPSFAPPVNRVEVSNPITKEICSRLGVSVSVGSLH